MSDSYFPLVTQDKPERVHLYKWINAEEEYVHKKFGHSDQRGDHDKTMANYDLEEFWIKQVVQYYDRARVALIAARELHILDDAESARHLEQKAQQAMAKAMMTAKGMVESSIRVFGDLPKPGLSSGYIEEWEA
jgi:hypothetical protein